MTTPNREDIHHCCIDTVVYFVIDQVLKQPKYKFDMAIVTVKNLENELWLVGQLTKANDPVRFLPANLLILMICLAIHDHPKRNKSYTEILLLFGSPTPFPFGLVFKDPSTEFMS